MSEIDDLRHEVHDLTTALDFLAAEMSVLQVLAPWALAGAIPTDAMATSAIDALPLADSRKIDLKITIVQHLANARKLRPDLTSLRGRLS